MCRCTHTHIDTIRWLGNQTAADQLTASVLALRYESASIGTTAAASYPSCQAP